MVLARIAPRPAPSICPVLIERALEKPLASASFAQDEQYRAGRGVSLGQNRRLTAFRLHPPDQRGYPDRRRQPGVGHPADTSPGTDDTDMRDRMKVPVPRATASPIAPPTRATAPQHRRTP